MGRWWALKVPLLSLLPQWELEPNLIENGTKLTQNYCYPRGKQTRAFTPVIQASLVEEFPGALASHGSGQGVFCSSGKLNLRHREADRYQQLEVSKGTRQGRRAAGKVPTASATDFCPDQE